MNERSPTGAVYVVDDDPGVLSSLRFLFETDGFQVKTFADGTELLAGPLPGPLDCLLIDYRLSSFDGLELVRRLNALKVATPVVMFTIYEGIERKAAKLGVHHVVLKSDLTENVVNRVEAVMAASRAAAPSA